MEKAPDSPGSENKWVEEEGRGRENDSDSNSDWMEREIKRRIEAFADLNEGEMNITPGGWIRSYASSGVEVRTKHLKSQSTWTASL